MVAAVPPGAAKGRFPKAGNVLVIRPTESIAGSNRIKAELRNIYRLIARNLMLIFST